MQSLTIEQTQEKIIKGSPQLILDRPCREGDGILCFSKQDIHTLVKKSEKSKKEITFFVPSSGSGSRMFEFLFQYLSKPDSESIGQTEHFFSQLSELGLYHYLPKTMRLSIENGSFDMEEVLNFILTEKGLNLGASPKALIPFHYRAPVVFNALQEQIAQAQQVHPNVVRMHFTTQEDHQKEFESSIEALTKLIPLDVAIDFSFQAKTTNSIALDENNNPVLTKSGEILERPSGHGALLQNLNQIDAEIILVKNIDNVQHWENSHLSKKWWNVLIGALDELKEQLQQVFETKNWSSFEAVNDYFQLVQGDSWRTWTEEQMNSFLNKPLRVCGMVKNIGQPGGGPYWVSENGITSKQIVEKAQISEEESQRRIMIRSTHFNPVMMALSPTNLKGEKLDLDKYVDPNKFFIVEKTQEGQQIKYLELPGLWNGSMDQWNTVFVEIPIATFSPVKSVLDLLDPLHKAKLVD